MRVESRRHFSVRAPNHRSVIIAARQTSERDAQREGAQRTWCCARSCNREDSSPGSVGTVATIRAFAVMTGGPAVGTLATVASLWSTGRALRHRRSVPTFAALTIAMTIAYATVVRPWSRRWGATAQEATMSLPGDELVETPGIQMTRAVTINAPTDTVWAWLAQIGQDRGGFYLENLAGARCATPTASIPSGNTAPSETRPYCTREPD
jgi:hypothetical protein